MTGDPHPIEQRIRDRGYFTDELPFKDGFVRARVLDRNRVLVATAKDRSRNRAWRMVEAALRAREETP